MEGASSRPDGCLSPGGRDDDEELAPAQGSNLESALGARVIDRTELILDIFAQHAASREGKIQVEGTVIEALPATQFKVRLDNGHELLAYLSGKMRKYYIRILLGDRVRVEMSPYDLTRGRIVYRHKKGYVAPKQVES